MLPSSTASNESRSSFRNRRTDPSASTSSAFTPPGLMTVATGVSRAVSRSRPSGQSSTTATGNRIPAATALQRLSRRTKRRRRYFSTTLAYPLATSTSAASRHFRSINSGESTSSHKRALSSSRSRQSSSSRRSSPVSAPVIALASKSGIFLSVLIFSFFIKP